VVAGFHFDGLVARLVLLLALQVRQLVLLALELVAHVLQALLDVVLLVLHVLQLALELVLAVLQLLHLVMDVMAALLAVIPVVSVVVALVVMVVALVVMAVMMLAALMGAEALVVVVVMVVVLLAAELGTDVGAVLLLCTQLLLQVVGNLTAVARLMAQMMQASLAHVLQTLTVVVALARVVTAHGTVARLMVMNALAWAVVVMEAASARLMNMMRVMNLMMRVVNMRVVQKMMRRKNRMGTQMVVEADDLRGRPRARLVPGDRGDLKLRKA